MPELFHLPYRQKAVFVSINEHDLLILGGSTLTQKTSDCFRVKISQCSVTKFAQSGIFHETYSAYGNRAFWDGAQGQVVAMIADDVGKPAILTFNPKSDSRPQIRRENQMAQL